MVWCLDRPRGRFFAPLLLLAFAASGAAGQSFVGRVMEAGTGRPIVMAELSLLSESGRLLASALSEDGGRFRLTAEQPGSFVISVSAIGYQDAVEGVFEVGANSSLTITVGLTPKPLALDAIVVSLERPTFEHSLVRSGFVDRFAEGFGDFITPVDIDRSAARRTTDLFQGMVGVFVRPPEVSRSNKVGGGGSLSYLGQQVFLQGPSGFCVPTVYVDGVRLRYDGDVSVDAQIPIESIDGIEVYRRASEVPPSYNATRMAEGGTCGVILFWTKGG